MLAEWSFQKFKYFGVVLRNRSMEDLPFWMRFLQVEGLDTCWMTLGTWWFCKESCGRHFNKAIRVTVVLNVCISGSVYSLPGFSSSSSRPRGCWALFRSLSQRWFFIPTKDPGVGGSVPGFPRQVGCVSPDQQACLFIREVSCLPYPSGNVPCRPHCALRSGTRPTCEQPVLGNEFILDCLGRTFASVALLFGTQHTQLIILCPLFSVESLGL